MTTRDPNPNKSSLGKRPFGIFVAESYFVTFMAISVQLAGRLTVLYPGKADLKPALFSLLRSSGKDFGTRHRRAVSFRGGGALAGASVGYPIWFYSTVLTFRMWTSVSHRLWPDVKQTAGLGFGIYIVWYLLLSQARHAFRPLQTSSAGALAPTLDDGAKSREVE
jgi:hypothetical protein